MFVIVKNAAPNDPAESTARTGKFRYAVLGDSAASSYTGKFLGIKEVYADTELPLAEKDCERMNRANPCGKYAVCKVGTSKSFMQHRSRVRIM